MGKLADVERPKLGNAVYKHPLRPQMVVMDPSDNLPRPAVASSMTDTTAPPLSPETLICMGDESVFVIRDRWGDVIVRLAPDLVRQECAYPRPWLVAVAVLSDDDKSALIRKGILPSAEVGVAADNEIEMPDFLQAEPLRAQCTYYRRVMTDFEGSAEHQQVERVCAAQRTEAGEFTSLSDTRVYACEHRLPRDFVSEERLRRFDEARIQEGKKTEEEWVPPTHGETNG